MADATTLAQNPFALLSLIAAPAVLTNSASVLALSTSNRFLRASERLRAIVARYDEAQSAEVRAHVVQQLTRVERQASMLLNTLRSHKIDPKRLITHRFKLERILDAYETFGHAANTRALKVIIEI